HRRPNRKERLEYRMLAAVPLGVDLLHYAIERHFSRCKAAQNRVTRLRQIVRKAEFRRGPRAYREGIQKVAHYGLELWPSPRVRCASDNQVVLAAVSE